MAILKASGPDRGIEQVAVAFTAMTHGDGDIFQVGSVPAAEILHPVGIFEVSLEKLWSEGITALHGARRIGWRYVVAFDSSLTALDLPEGPDHHPIMITNSDVAHNLIRAGRKAARMVGDKATYEPRILDLNMIGNSVLWLHDLAGQSTELFFSLSKTPRILNPASLMKRLQREAGRKLMAMPPINEISFPPSY